MTYTLSQEEEWKQKISKAARERGPQAPEVIERSGEEYEQYFFEYFKSHSKGDNSQAVLLDAGCGTGKIAKKLADKGFQVYGVDFSPDIISLAKQYAPHVNFQTSFLYKLPFSSHMFDTIVCLGLFQTVGNMNQALQEISRVLKPGGILIVRAPNSLSLGSFFLDKSIHFFNPYAFSSFLSRFSLRPVALKGVYVFPPFLRGIGYVVLKTGLFRVFNLLFPLCIFFAHSFYLEAKKTQ